ncbi:CIA30 family protein [Tropicibacter sp. R16_0]|uniref:CIA30 family protein n=1 Tax=Tropicibacter sp. R16_0 TaxID=2821102 RepID=UPI001ADC09F9|nr:CIA30 family protein [Tropicibacter sp. R16_0]MBO9453113.1 CIA30 family protein [Tropicibacter sp. R16_0]
MWSKALFLAAIQTLFLGGAMAIAEPFETFETAPETRWSYVADTVMGGVSTGTVQFTREGQTAFARLEGTVSTANNGGFIQFRRALSDAADADAQGLRLRVRGNGQTYFVHLRTTGTRLPWQYYQASFETSGNWREIRIPFSAFERSGRLLRKSVKSGALTSVGIVAYGRDHSAQVDVSEVAFY